MRNATIRGIAAGAVVASAAVVAAAVVSNAGAGSTAAPAAAAPAAVDPRAGGLEVGLGEWGLGLEAKAIRPGRVTLVITNRGKLVHGLEIEPVRDRSRRGRDRDRDRDDLDRETERLAPGQTVRMTLDLAPGVYKVECFVSDHDDMGMEALLTVRADAPLVAAPKAATNTVQITNFVFKPAVLTTTAGATVRWRNVDPVPHTATGSAFDSKLLNRNGTYARRFTTAGTYSYICALHPAMKGKVVVR
jgi:plastocyanin